MATIFTPQNLSPRNEVLDMSINQSFTATIDGVKCTDYQVRIYRVSDNALLYNSGKLTLGTPLADNEVLTYTVPSGSVSNSATESYKWTLQVWNSSETVTSRETQFYAKTTPVLTFTFPNPITTQSYEFTATIAQAEGDIVSSFTFNLYDSLGGLVESSGSITNFNMSYIFDGMSGGDQFSIRLNGITTGGQTFNSGLIPFDVDYLSPDINMKPEATVDNNSSFITLERGIAVQIIGSSSGSISYRDDFIYVGNKGGVIENASSYATFDVDIPLENTVTFKWKPLSESFEGKIIQLDNGAYEVGYVLGRFYYEINGIRNYTLPTSLVNSVFYIVMLPQSIQFTRYDYVI